MTRLLVVTFTTNARWLVYRHECYAQRELATFNFVVYIFAEPKQNAELLAKWLDNAKFYISRYRRVPVEEHLVFGNAVYPAASSSRFYKTATQLNTQNLSQLKPEPSRLITQSPSKELINPLINAVVALSNETARADYGALIFCSSRLGCEKDAILISQVLPTTAEIDPLVAERRRDLLSDLRSTTTGLDPVLARTIPSGVAFHRESCQ